MLNARSGKASLLEDRMQEGFFRWDEERRCERMPQNKPACQKQGALPKRHVRNNTYCHEDSHTNML